MNGSGDSGTPPTTHHYPSPMKSIRDFEFGSRQPDEMNIALLLSEMEGTYQHLKYMGFKEDMDTIEEMKKRYWKLYFKAKKNAP